MSLIWGFGVSLTAPARPKYSLFLHELIQKRFGGSCTFDFKKRVDMSLFPRSGCSLYQVSFHKKDHLWYSWDYEIDRYDILGNKNVEVEAKCDVTPLSDEESVHGGDASPRSGNSHEEFSSKVEF